MGEFIKLYLNGSFSKFVTKYFVLSAEAIKVEVIVFRAAHRPKFVCCVYSLCISAIAGKIVLISGTCALFFAAAQQLIPCPS